MKRVEINGRTYALPFASLLRPLTDDERDQLAASVETHGVMQAVVTYTSPTHGRSVIDGMHRAVEAERQGRDDVPTLDLGRLPDEDARERCLDLNLSRRHLSAAEIEQAADARRVRVAGARAAGESLRAIADREGVSLAQVQRDAAREAPAAAGPPGVPGGTPEPGKVKGRDGKTYSQRREDTPEQLLDRTRKTCDRLVEGLLALADGDLAADLLALAPRHGVTFRQDDGGCLCETAVSLRSLLADVAARAATR